MVVTSYDSYFVISAFCPFGAWGRFQPPCHPTHIWCPQDDDDEDDDDEEDDEDDEDDEEDDEVMLHWDHLASKLLIKYVLLLSAASLCINCESVNETWWM